MNIKYQEQIIKIDRSVIKIMYENRQKNETEFEVGGMVIGYRLKSNNALIISDVTLPMETDSQSKYTFVRSDAHNYVLEKKWLASQMTVMYMGEWHTHFEKCPNNSLTDIVSWKKLMKYAITEADILLFFINGTDMFRIWVGDRRNKKIQMIYEGDWMIDD